MTGSHKQQHIRTIM